MRSRNRESKWIYVSTAMFQIGEQGFDHQDQPPFVPGPEGLASELELAGRIAEQIPSPIREKLLCRRPIEVRPVDPMNPFAPERREPVRYNWVKAIGRMPDDPAVHQYMLAYASDYGLVATSLYPHGQSFWQPNMQVASLDHAMWFHRDFRMDDWLLYAMQSPNACHARGLAHGQVFTREGVLVASVAQEGLIRQRLPVR
jgi:acyl-CoA thioesterase II